MKKQNGIIFVGKKLLLISTFILIFFTACNDNSNAKNGLTKIVVGATPVPHAEILEVIKPLLKEQGYELEIKIFNDYVIPNKVTNSGEIDANFFQHLPYMLKFNEQQKTNLVGVVAVHLEPMGIYSKKIKSLDDLKEGDSVAIPNDPTNTERALDVLEVAGLIKTEDAEFKTKLNIIENPKNLKITELEVAQLPRVLADFTIAVINTNYALPAGLNPNSDTLAIESKESPYANFLVVKAGKENSEKIEALKKALTSDIVKSFILEKYKGAILPAF